jgi:hypothetical protein
MLAQTARGEPMVTERPGGEGRKYVPVAMLSRYREKAETWVEASGLDHYNPMLWNVSDTLTYESR